MLSINIDLYFLRFDIEKHPVLKKMVDDVTEKVCKEEGVKVLNVSYRELNEGETSENKMAVGRYVYTLDEDYAIKSRESYVKAKEIENEYGRTYGEICKVLNIDTENKTADDFYLPRILLSYDQLSLFGLNSYYGTYFHEIGHHFAAKELGEHTEDDANMYGHRTILENLPLMFQLIPEFNFNFRLNDTGFKLSKMQRMRALKEYLRYYIKHRKTIIRKKKG